MSEFVNRRGVNLVSTECLRLEWFFREQHVSDQGVDAVVEKAPEEVGTGRLLALQIKSGPSYFREATGNGWWFRFDSREAKLWLGHALPVLVVLADVDNGVAYWQRICSRTVVSTGKGYKVEVTASQVLQDADAEWTELASGLELRAVERWDFTLTQLPPGVRRVVNQRPAAERPDAALLALHLAEGRGNPRDTVEALLAVSPNWIARHASWSWRAIASYSAEHDLRDLSAEAFERAAAGQEPGYGALLAAAALNILPLDRPRSRRLVAAADAVGDAPLVVAIVRALLEHPDGDAGACRVDPVLLADNGAIRTSQVVQNFLSDQAIRSGDLDKACHHSHLALQADPDDSSTMAMRANTLVRRSRSNLRQEDDLSTAIGLLEQAIEQRHGWAGPTLDPLLALLQAYVHGGQFDLMLQRCLPGPIGPASPDEAEHPQIRRGALYAAHALGRPDITEHVAAALGDSVQDRIALLQTGHLRLTPEEQQRLWDDELRRALADDDFEAVVVAAVALAFFGQDERHSLRSLVDRSIVASIYLELVAALVSACADLDTALPTLRSLARRDATCAGHVVHWLAAQGRGKEAAALCHMLYERDSDPYFLVTEAQLVIGADADHAESIARQAVTSTSSFPIERAQLFTYLGVQSARRGEWSAAEDHFGQALRLCAHPASADVWRLVFAQVEQGHLHRAVRTIAEHQPAVTNSEEGTLWLRAHVAVAWNEAIASEAFMLAQRLDDPRLSTALLTHIVTGTHGVPDDAAAEVDVEADAADDLVERRRSAQQVVPAELHRQAFNAIQQLVGRFGEATGVTILHGDPDQLARQMLATMQETAAASASVEEILGRVRDAWLPLGFVATVQGRGYATTLVQRSLGVLISGAADDDEHALDVHAARHALDMPTVVDASALLVLTGMSSAARLEGEFPVLELPAEAMRDIYRASHEIRALAGSPGSTSWNRHLDGMVFYPLSEDEYGRQLRRAQALEDLARRVTVRTLNDFSLFSELMQDPKHASWLHPIQLAHSQGAALWSDDLGLRRLARSAGIACFGTPALIDALRDRGLDNATTAVAHNAILEQTAADNRDLALDMTVDVALHLQDLLHIAEHDGWLPRAGAVVLARASWWAWQPQPTRDLLILYQRVSTHAPTSLPDWQHAAMAGLAKAVRPPDAAAQMLAQIALLGFGDPTVDIVTAGMRRARRVATELNLPDPLAHLAAAASALAGAGQCTDPQTLTTAVFDQLRDEPA